MHAEWLCISERVYIYPCWQVGMCERWEVWNPTRRQIHTGRRTHTSPSHLDRDLHTPHTDHCPSSSSSPTSSHHPSLHTGLLLVPSLFPRCIISLTATHFECAISLWLWEVEESRIMTFTLHKVQNTILVHVFRHRWVCMRVCAMMIKCWGMLCHMTSLFPLSSLLDRAVQC